MPLLRCLLILILCSALAARGAEPEPPNIIFILADDLGINDLDCDGRKDQPTPNLDRLAQQGMRFTSAYAAQPVCSPTRAAILTGKTPARLNLTTFLPGRPDAPSQRLLNPRIEQQLPLAEHTAAELLKRAGYVTGCLGKWHLGGAGFGPREQGFDWAMEAPANTKPSAEEGGKGEVALTEMAEQFIDTNKDRRFFLYLAHNNPHVPLGAQPALIAKHADAFNPTYAAMIETLDRCVGRILARLDSLRLTQRTMIIFTSDNGGLHVLETPGTPATHNTPFRAGKGFIYEGGLRVPLIVRWPGHVAAGTMSAIPVISTDWLPTWLEAVGAPALEGLDGVSLVPLLTGGGLAPRNLYWHFPHYSNQGGRPAGAVRSGDWKLVEHYEDGRAELFDLAHDPGESTDLSAQQPERAATLRDNLAAWRASVGAEENLPNPSFDPELARKLYADVDVSRLRPEKTAAATSTQLQDWRETMDAVVKSNLIVTDSRPVLVLTAQEAQITGSKLRYDLTPGRCAINGWTQLDDFASWIVGVSAPGTYRVELLYGCSRGSAGSLVDVELGDQILRMSVQETGHADRFISQEAGRVTLPAGPLTVALRVAKKGTGAVMTLRQIALIPAEEASAAH